MTPGAARQTAIALGALVVVVSAVATRGTGNPARVVTVRYLYSTDAEAMLAPLLARFNSEHHVVGGRSVVVDGEALNSGEAETAIAKRQRAPVLWTPASSLWGRLLDHDAGAHWVESSVPSLVASPQVIAMWENLARALGYPSKRLGWRDVLELATSSHAWAAHGHPKFDPFRLGHTNPDISTSGLSAVASEYYAVTGKRSGLSLADVRRPDVRQKVRAIEHSIVHYGKTATDFTDQMDIWGQPYAHAVYVQETQLRKFNEHRRQTTRLVGIEPAEGTFVADYPVIALRAPWVSSRTRASASVFARWLKAQITPELAAKNGFRVRPPRGLAMLEPPSPAVLAAIRSGWRRDRKAANIALVVDTSSSMAASGRIDAARAALRSFLRPLSPADRVALLTSGHDVRTLVGFGEGRARVKRALGSLFPNGELPVYGAVSRAIDAVRSLRDPTRINAVVVLSDGASTSDGLAALLAKIAAHPPTEGTPVRVFTVAYGDNANNATLRQIAARSGGAFFAGRPKDIEDVYRSVSSYF